MADVQFELENIKISSYKINKAMKLLHIEINDTQLHPEFLFVDSDNRIQKFTIDFTTAATARLYDQSLSDPLDYYPYSASSKYMKIALSY